MNNSIKSGFLILSGTIGIVGIIIAAMISPATSWVTPPGRMIVSILDNGLLIPFILFLILFGIELLMIHPRGIFVHILK